MICRREEGMKYKEKKTEKSREEKRMHVKKSGNS
jgi:hypothetical protein